jgi:MFS family permease
MTRPKEKRIVSRGSRIRPGGHQRAARSAAAAGRTTFAEVFGIAEFRALWLAQVLSVAGDQLARVALTLLVFEQTRSSLLAAITFAASVVPVFIGGFTLAGLADRWPRRRVMMACDLGSALLVGLMALPAMPIAARVGLLVLVTMISAPFISARAALYPDILAGDRYVLGTAVTLTTIQFAQVLGFALGGAVVAFVGARAALLADAATFVLSAGIVRLWVRARPAARAARPSGVATGPEHPAAGPGHSATGPGHSATEPGHSATEPGHSATGPGHPAAGLTAGLRLVFRSPALLFPMLLGWLAAFYNIPEGVAAPLAHSLGGGDVAVGLILAAGAFGAAAGAVLFSRLARPQQRLRLMGPLAIASCAVLGLFVFHPALPWALLVLTISGLCASYQLPANAAFVQAVPAEQRSQAFGIAQGGMSLGQGAAMILAGAAAEQLSPSLVTAVGAAIGAIAAFVIVLARPGAQPRNRPRARRAIKK